MVSFPPPPGSVGPAHPHGGGAPPPPGGQDRSRRGGWFGWILAGVGVGLLLGAVGVAAYTALRTSSPYCSTTGCDEAASTAVTVAWWTVAVAAVIAVLAIWRLRARARAAVWVRVAAVLAAVGVAVGYVVVGIGASDFAASGPRIWLVRVVVGATIVGCLLVGASWLSAQDRRAGLAAAVAVGAAVILVGVAAIAAPNEYDPVDATTAAPVDIPAEPETLGREQFRLSVPYFRPRIDAAGAGFIVWTPYWAKDGSTPVLTAYDNAGAPRWHYGRGPDQRMTRVRVYDEGSVVVVGFAGDDKRGRAPEMVGLDAVTGEQLWTSRDLGIWNALDIDEGGSFTSFVERGEKSWTGFNARTGEQRWQIPNPAACGDGPLDTVSSLDEPYTVRVADRGNRLVTVNDCSTPDTIKLRVLAHDAVTGEQLGAWPVPGADGVPRDTWKYLSVDRSVGDSVSVSLEKECAERAPHGPCITAGESRHMLLNYLTGQPVDVPPGAFYPATDGRGDYVLAAAREDSSQVQEDRPTDLMNADGSLRCQFARQGWAGGVPTWLAKQFVIQRIPSDRGKMEVVVLNRDTCQVENTLPWPFESAKKTKMGYITDSKGATLLVQNYDDETSDIIGYAP